MATPSHVDLSVLWVPIMPETSKFDDTMAPAMEKAGKDAKDKFQRATKDIGRPITEELEKAGTKTQDKFKDTGEKISETFRKSGKDSADNFSDELSRGSSKFDGIATTLGKNVGAKLGEALHGGLGGALDKLEGVTKNIGVDISEWTTPLKDVASPLQDLQTGAGDIKSKIQDWTRDVESLPGKLGKVGTAIGELAGPISVVAASWAAALKIRPPESGPDWNKRDDGSVDPWKLAAGPVGTWLEKKYHNIFGGGGDQPTSKPPTPSDYSDLLLGTGGSSDQASGNFKPGGDPARWGGTLGSASDAYDFFSSGQNLPSSTSSGTKAPASVPSSTDKVPSSFVGNLSSSFSNPRDLKAGGSRVANLYAVAQSLEGTPYSQALRNDCSGMVSKLATAALGMAPSVQFSTVNEGDWLFSHGFKPGMGGPNDLSIGWYDHGGGNAGHTAATLPGGINAESGGAGGGFRLGPGAAGADNPEFTNHAYLPMGGKMPAGTDSDPIYTAMSKNSANGDSSSTQSQADQFGQGFLGGIMQSVGLDGSVFKSFGGASNPMDFGVTKLGTGLLNWGMGMAQQRTGGGGGDGSMLPGLGALIPHAPVAAPTQPGNTTIVHGDVNSGFQVTQHGVQGDGTQGFGEAYNSSVGSGRATAAPLPNASFGPSAGMP